MMVGTRRRTYLIQDPYDTDAQRFIQTIFTYFGLRPICFFTDPKGRFYGQKHFPMLRSGEIEAAYDVSLDDLETFVHEITEKYDVLAVIPYREDTVEVAAELCGLLDLGWNQADTIARFRDKNELKAFIRQTDPSVRVPMSRLVATVEDVFDADTPDRFVIKPNDGFGNRAISMFDSTQRTDVEAKLADRDTTWILEEFIDGEEYEIDGQVRQDGTVEVLAVYRYNRVMVNDYSTVYHSEVQLRTHDPIFTVCADYATALMTATGLRASPFHMEAKIDDRGPAMVDLGARLPSNGGGDGLSRLHPTRPDVYTVAAHDYFGSACESGPIDWTHYDAAAPDVCLRNLVRVRTRRAPRRDRGGRSHARVRLLAESAEPRPGRPADDGAARGSLRCGTPDTGRRRRHRPGHRVCAFSREVAL